MLCNCHFRKNDYVITGSCGHKFHEKCLHEWIMKSHFANTDEITCPICGKFFFKNEDEPSSEAPEEEKEPNIDVKSEVSIEIVNKQNMSPLQNQWNGKFDTAQWIVWRSNTASDSYTRTCKRVRNTMRKSYGLRGWKVCLQAWIPTKEKRGVSGGFTCKLLRLKMGNGKQNWLQMWHRLNGRPGSRMHRQNYWQSVEESKQEEVLLYHPGRPGWCHHFHQTTWYENEENTITEQD